MPDPFVIVVPYLGSKKTSQRVVVNKATGRPRVIPSDTTKRLTEDLVVRALAVRGRRPMIDGAVRVDILARFARPKSGPFKDEKIGGYVMADRYDRSNLANFVDDALQGVLYSRDGKVAAGEVLRIWGVVDSMVITVSELPDVGDA